ncbi:MAG TPA: hypothetical protein VJB57_13855 [Dehalococcoidia bacterium]|nr:hypothetical protein [Dehalococcoidia bacterium]
MTQRHDLIARLQAQLSHEMRAALQACLGFATAQGIALYLVGGAVRDLMRGDPHVDLDLALEGDAAMLASAVASAIGGRAVSHARFGTATLKAPDVQVDLVRTRRETYARPGALPDVEPASLQEDLKRRDFTINAMALQLTLNPGELIDPFGGKLDLDGGLLRVLHEASFQDDATRMLRATRYAARLGFKIEPSTAEWLQRDLRFLEAISPMRLRRELELLWNEPSAVDAALIAHNLGVLRSINACMFVSDFSAGRWRQALSGEHFAPLDQLGLCMMTHPITGTQVEELVKRLRLTRPQEKAVRDFAALDNHAGDRLASLRFDPFAMSEALEGKAPAAIWALAYLSGEINEECLLYLRDWRHLRPHLRGDDLVELGVSPGPAVGEMLKTLRAARLRGLAETREDELALVRSELGNGEG